VAAATRSISGLVNAGRFLLIYLNMKGLVNMPKCKLSGKRPQSGNNVPWSKKRTRRVWQPNIQKFTLFVPELGRSVTIKASAKAMKSVNKLGFMIYLRKHNLQLRDVI
jgi:large subunit ribosomal protein L28